MFNYLNYFKKKYFVFILFFILFNFSIPTQIFSNPNNFTLAQKTVVKINVTALQYDYRNPWNTPSINAFSGTGFIINGKRILTNAHVVSGVNTIRIQRADQPKDYEAELAFIAHDCDLAILKVRDESFFENTVPLEIGKLPEINSPVEVVGFPIGGQRISITRGIVSRLDMDIYSHSGIDSHLIIQVDAAINPGNSGGPALQNGLVIGVAFQALLGGQSLGYLIPPVVINRFLEDIKDGVYDGYNEFGVIYNETNTPSLKNYFKINDYVKDSYSGIFIYDILPGSTAENILKKKDILLKINGKPISGKGDVNINGNLINYTELIDNLNSGDPINVEVLRNGKIIKLNLISKISRIFDFKRINYEDPPSYLICGGMVFQPLDANLMKTYGGQWLQSSKTIILFRYNYFTQTRLYKKVKEDVILTSRLSDDINIYSENFLHNIVSKVNGVKIKGYKHFYDSINKILNNNKNKNEYLVIEFYKKEIPLVFKIKDLKVSIQKIKKKLQYRTN